jgi:hypothetical protein
VQAVAAAVLIFPLPPVVQVVQAAAVQVARPIQMEPLAPLIQVAVAVVADQMGPVALAAPV